jgi:glycosyltransferase involved in cell wall biosynthesis
MPALANKIILIISPQSWGNMFLSKHHYAIELAKKGNDVYFLNPPGEGRGEKRKRVEVIPSGITPRLWFIRHSLWFPYNLKFHALPLFHFLMRFQVDRIRKEIGRPIDIIWSFDLGNLYPFRLFGGRTFKLFHPVDEPLNKAAIDSASGAAVIFSVTTEILEKYRDSEVPKYFINHGVAAGFLSSGDGNVSPDIAVRVGFSGNLLREDLDRDTFLKIITESPDVRFECWGSYTVSQSNIGGMLRADTEIFITKLKGLPNVVLHGPVPSEALAAAIQNMDAFLICYDIQKDQSGGTNYHKIMEYLSTGKVIISNNVTTYRDQPHLVQMVSERDNNQRLPGLFRQVISSLETFNAPALQRERRAFAAENSYTRQVERIEMLLEPIVNAVP